MKMKQDHYKELKTIMEYGLNIKPQLNAKYIKHGLTAQRYIWDVFNTCVPIAFCKKLHSYLYDQNIETALMRIMNKEGYKNG